MRSQMYQLVDKKVYAHVGDAIPFWEGASLERARQYALDEVKLFVAGGDGANWTGRGADELGNAIFPLDGFHLSRACGCPVRVAGDMAENSALRSTTRYAQDPIGMLAR